MAEVKAFYTIPEMEVIQFEAEDIITASAVDDSDGTGDDGWDDSNWE